MADKKKEARAYPRYVVGADGRRAHHARLSRMGAAEVAEALHATKIIYLTPHAGLEVSGTVRREIAVEALKDVNMRIAPGEVVGLLGA